MDKSLISSLNSLKYLLISVLLFFCSQINQSQPMEKIQSISITAWGGERGYHRSLKITSDSLFYEYGSVVDSINNRNIKKINSYYKLEDVIAAKKLVDFSKTKSGKSRQPVDGTDTEIIVKTDGAEFKVTNAENDNLWRNVMKKMNAIIEKEFKETE